MFFLGFSVPARFWPVFPPSTTKKPDKRSKNLQCGGESYIMNYSKIKEDGDEGPEQEAEAGAGLHHLLHPGTDSLRTVPLQAGQSGGAGVYPPGGGKKPLHPPDGAMYRARGHPHPGNGGRGAAHPGGGEPGGLRHLHPRGERGLLRPAHQRGFL